MDANWVKERNAKMAPYEDTGCRVLLHDTRTGRKEWINAVYCAYPPDEPHREYIWREGNYACDCNRSIFLDLDEDIGCSHDLIRLEAYIHND